VQPIHRRLVFIRDGEVVTTNSGTISYATAESLLDL
jgi:hypothetical protein